MKRVFNHLRVLTLFIAVTAINIHMIIPHDHHPAELCPEQDDSCPVTKNAPDHHTGLPIHCHACNDLASEKASNLIILKHIHNILFNGSSDSTPVSIPDFFVTAFFEKEIIFSYSESQDITSLRAPPSLV